MILAYVILPINSPFYQYRNETLLRRGSNTAKVPDSEGSFSFLFFESNCCPVAGRDAVAREEVTAWSNAVFAP